MTDTNNPTGFEFTLGAYTQRDVAPEEMLQTRMSSIVSPVQIQPTQVHLDFDTEAAEACGPHRPQMSKVQEILDKI